MTASARRAKKNINQDQLVTATVRVGEWAQEHFNQVLIGVVVLVATVAVVVFVANSRDSNSRQAERQMGAAMTLMQQGDLNAARGSFEQIALRQGGDRAVAARFFQAECEFRMGNYAQAALDYDAYLARKADYPMFAASAAVGRGLSYEATQQWDLAGASLVDALTLLEKDDPRYYDTAFRAANAYERAGETGQALKYYEIVADHESGQLRERARIAVSALK
jgi:tetratricopeptide (TPR) repeat protein